MLCTIQFFSKLCFRLQKPVNPDSLLNNGLNVQNKKSSLNIYQALEASVRMSQYLCRHKINNSEELLIIESL